MAITSVESLLDRLNALFPVILVDEGSGEIIEYANQMEISRIYKDLVLLDFEITDKKVLRIYAK